MCKLHVQRHFGLSNSFDSNMDESIRTRLFLRTLQFFRQKRSAVGKTLYFSNHVFGHFRAIIRPPQDVDVLALLVFEFEVRTLKRFKIYRPRPLPFRCPCRLRPLTTSGGLFKTACTNRKELKP